MGDFIVYFGIALVYAVLIFIFDTRLIFHTNGGFGAFVFVLLMLGVVGLPWAYIMSFPFKSAPSAYAIQIISAIVLGICGTLAVVFLKMFYDPECTDCADLGMISDIIRYIISWLGPFFAFAQSVFVIVDVQEQNSVCANALPKNQLNQACQLISQLINMDTFDNSSIFTLSSIIACCDTRWEVPEDYQLCGQELNTEGTLIPCRETLSFWTWDSQTGININIVILAVNVLIFWAVLIFTELNITKLLWIKMKEMVYGSKVAMPTNIDSDVKQEKDTVFQTVNAMTVCNLSKKFGSFDAVRGLTFGVRDKECFGLLGVNGAGKTTTFRMLTGDEIMSSGEAFIGNESLSGNRASYLQSIGYCPQFDSIIEVLTGREMLSLFARIRGLRSSENRINTELEKLASFVDLTQYLDRPCGQYSGGNKRKLNVALALIGRPKVMLLDEPTTGVDPAARRKMWETINAIRRSGTSIILTSHSMEECEALCDRLAIMVRGSFQCLGGPQHIKSKFGKGFQIIIKLEPMSEAVNGIGNINQKQATKSALELLNSSVVKAFDSCSVTDEHMDYVHFHVANPQTSWSHLFGTMELIKKEHTIVQDYSVSETTLEQIFLGFARSEETTEI